MIPFIIMSNLTNPVIDPAVASILKLTACLEQAAKVSADLHQAVRDLQEIAKMQQERIERLEARLNGPSRSFAA